MNLFRIGVLIALLAVCGEVRGNFVIQLATPADAFCLNLGTVETIDLFVVNTGIDTQNVRGVRLALEVRQSGVLATGANVPRISDVETLTSSGSLFDGISQSTVTDVFNSDQTQRNYQWIAGDLFDVNDTTNVELPGNVARPFASVTLDTSHMTIGGDYTLSFEIDTGMQQFPTEFRSETNLSILTAINTGGPTAGSLTSGLSFQVKAIPEPNAFQTCGLVGSLLLIVRRQQMLWMSR